MGAPKYASLHSGLLARKGEAQPASPQPLMDVRFTDDPVALTPAGRSGSAPGVFTPAPGSKRSSPSAMGSSGAGASPLPGAPAYRRPKGVSSSSSDPQAEDAPSKQTRSRARVTISARHRRLLQLLKLVRGRTSTDVVADALEAHLLALGETDMRGCGCFQRTLKIERKDRPAAPAD